MLARYIAGVVAAFALGLAVWFGHGQKPETGQWRQVAPGVLRSGRFPAGYALIDGESALLIDAPHGPEGLAEHGVKKVEAVLLTHHHHDTVAAAADFLKAGTPVRAPRSSAAWLTPDNVRKFWKESLPLRSSRTAYFVVPEGIAGVDCSLTDGQTISWHGWTIEVIATPGHSPDHVSYAARRGQDGPLYLFAGDALASPGKLWTPYTTDWDHWTDLGLKPTAESLRKLAKLAPALVLPAHGEMIDRDVAGALTRTAKAVEEMAFLKSFERYTTLRLRDQPEYPFLAAVQAESNGSKPWSQVSEHLFITGNTYVLISKDNACLIVDPWDKRSADQIALLQREHKLGPIEVVMFSHAHYDHYDGVYHLPGREQFRTWTLDCVATPLAQPYLLRAPFLDARPVRIDRRFQDGDRADWREYHFRFHHLPGQSEYTMGVEATIDGKRCFFTADNFFHQYQFSGTGGWMGLNRSWPLPYADSARKVLEAAPEWVLAEHGGPFEFNAEDFRRRVRWGQVSAVAADALCVSGNHRHDWDPHRVHVEPLVQSAKPGATLKATLVVTNSLAAPQTIAVTLPGRGLIGNQGWKVEVPAGGTTRREFTLHLAENAAAGRHVFPLRVEDGGVDAFLVVDVE